MIIANNIINDVSDDFYRRNVECRRRYLHYSYSGSTRRNNYNFILKCFRRDLIIDDVENRIIKNSALKVDEHLIVAIYGDCFAIKFQLIAQL